jgi:1-acyl-sn-glycerol-3-phosphate acyltransferase
MASENLAAFLLCEFAKLVTGVRPIWRGSAPDARRRVYFANHRSHGDFVLIWASLPEHVRYMTRPVAGADYWSVSTVRRYIANRVFRAVLIDRTAGQRQSSPIDQMGEALSAGESLIIFPEGTRNLGDDLLPFKSGIYHLAKAHPEAEFIPVWIENLGRVMPKGSYIPVPLLCSLTYGAPLIMNPEETKAGFLERARAALLNLAPAND